MSRVKRGVTANRKRKKILSYTKGFRWGRKSKERAAKEALIHAWSHAFRGRKEKKRDYRALWNVNSLLLDVVGLCKTHFAHIVGASD